MAWPSPLRVGLSALAAFVGYGAWALWINGGWRAAGASGAALAQALYSGTVTLVLASLVEALANKIPFEARAITVGLPCTLLGASSYGMHSFRGTPEPWLTMLPSYLISCVTVLVLVQLLYGQQKGSQTASKAPLLKGPGRSQSTSAET